MHAREKLNCWERNILRVFLETFSDVRVAIGVHILYLQFYYYAILLLSLNRSDYIWLYYNNSMLIAYCCYSDSDDSVGILAF